MDKLDKLIKLLPQDILLYIAKYDGRIRYDKSANKFVTVFYEDPRVTSLKNHLESFRIMNLGELLILFKSNFFINVCVTDDDFSRAKNNTRFDFTMYIKLEETNERKGYAVRCYNLDQWYKENNKWIIWSYSNGFEYMGCYY